MSSDVEVPVTVLLQQVREGDREAADRLVPVLFRELHNLACIYLKREGSGHTLQPTALVNEAYLKLIGDQARAWECRSHFIGVAASVMRRLLIDHARRKKSEKRQAPPVDSEDYMTVEEAEELLALNIALDRLAQMNARYAKVVELRYFGGLSIEETAEALQVAPMTIKRDWIAARAFLKQQVRPSVYASASSPIA
jgi:RNA polymerase sigma factor (TIGR02999 family)